MRVQPVVDDTETQAGPKRKRPRNVRRSFRSIRAVRIRFPNFDAVITLHEIFVKQRSVARMYSRDRTFKQTEVADLCLLVWGFRIVQLIMVRERLL